MSKLTEERQQRRSDDVCCSVLVFYSYLTVETTVVAYLLPVLYCTASLIARVNILWKIEKEEKGEEKRGDFEILQRKHFLDFIFEFDTK
jgi:hypothetical protein